jgi:hypothetical protein
MSYSFISFSYSCFMNSNWLIFAFCAFCAFCFHIDFTELSFAQTATSIHRDVFDFTLLVLVLRSDLLYMLYSVILWYTLIYSDILWYTLIYSAMLCLQLHHVLNMSISTSFPILIFWILTSVHHFAFAFAFVLLLFCFCFCLFRVLWFFRTFHFTLSSLSYIACGYNLQV